MDSTAVKLLLTLDSYFERILFTAGWLKPISEVRYCIAVQFCQCIRPFDITQTSRLDVCYVHDQPSLTISRALYMTSKPQKIKT